jgi:hypothetical protein
MDRPYRRRERPAVDRVLSLSDRITVPHQGCVTAEGAPAEIANDPAVAEAYLGRDRGARPIVPTAAAPSVAAEPLLVLQAVHAGYDGSEILHDVALYVRPGEVVALLGRNGVGKTTTLRAIMGVLKPRSGRVQFAGRDITRLTPDRINRLGIAEDGPSRRRPHLLSSNLCRDGPPDRGVSSRRPLREPGDRGIPIVDERRTKPRASYRLLRGIEFRQNGFDIVAARLHSRRRRSIPRGRGLRA